MSVCTSLRFSALFPKLAVEKKMDISLILEFHLGSFLYKVSQRIHLVSYSPHSRRKKDNCCIFFSYEWNKITYKHCFCMLEKKKNKAKITVKEPWMMEFTTVYFIMKSFKKLNPWTFGVAFCSKTLSLELYLSFHHITDWQTGTTVDGKSPHCTVWKSRHFSNLQCRGSRSQNHNGSVNVI